MTPMTAITAMTAAPATAATRARRGERGSAFIIALLVLLVLTVAGLALTMMTQTEMRIGANERETNRTFYAADSGIHVSTARTLWLGVSQQQIPPILLNTTQQDQKLSSPPPLTFEDQVTVTPLFQMRSDALLPKSSINQNQQIRYVKATYAVNATSTRVGQNTGSSTYTQTMAQKVVAAMIAIQPSTESLNYNPPTGLKQ